MKTEDLMIGDWVLHKYSNTAPVFLDENVITKEERTFTNTIKVESVDKHGISYKAETLGGYYISVKAEELEPIPITKEILEKNGFVKFCIYSNAWNLTEDDNRITIGRVYDDNLHDFIYFIDKTPICSLRYVHELQHIFKIFGFNKQIEL